MQNRKLKIPGMPWLNTGLVHHIPIVNGFLLVVLSLIIPWSVQAQSPDSVVFDVIRYNPELRALDMEYESAKYREGEFADFPDPVISTGFFPLPVETRLGPQRLKIGISQTLPWNNVLENRAQVAREEAERISISGEIARADMALAVRKLYARIWENDREISVLQQRFPILDAWYEVALSKVASNQGGASDVLQIQIFINEIRNGIQVLQQDKKNYLVRLNRLLGEKRIDTIRTEGYEIQLKPNRLDVVKNGNIDALPDLAWFDQEIQISDAILARNTTEGLPSIGLGLDYVVVGRRDDATPRYNGRDIVMPMLSVKMPVYRKKYKAVEQREKSHQVAISLRKSDKKLEIQQQIDEAHVLIQKEQNNLDFYDEQLEILDRTIDILGTEYSNKGVQFDELLKLQNQRIDFALKQLESKVNIYLARLIIQRWQP